jgi:type II secretory pathway component GspD/PulD (secretin)
MEPNDSISLWAMAFRRGALGGVIARLGMDGDSAMTRKGLLVFLILITPSLYAQRIRAMDFRNRPIADILMVLADTAGASVMVDETVTGAATFHFTDSAFADALRRFTEACHLHAVEREGIWYISRIALSSGEQGITISAEDTELEHLVKALSRNLGVTILYDQLPRMQLSVFAKDAKVQDILEILVKRVPEYAVLNENGAWYLRRQSETPSSSSSARLSSSSIRRNGEVYTMNIQRGNLSAILSLLFRTGQREYSLLNRTESTLENLYFADKSFEELLRLVCEQGNCDFAVTGTIYYIFEVQRRDVLKKFKETQVIELRNLSVAELTALLPGDYSASSFIKPSSQTNSVYLTGSPEEIEPIAAFIAMAESEAGRQELKRYDLRYLKVDDFIKLLPKNLADTAPRVVPGANAFIVSVNQTADKQFAGFIATVDKPNSGMPVKLRYITSEELLKFLPPSVSKEEIIVTLDPSLIFFTGSMEKRYRFDEELSLLDQPKPQIRYQILVIQYQKSNNFQWGSAVTVNPTSSSEHIVGSFSNLLNVNFDVITELGHRFALQLNTQLGEDKARILADTTLNGISGQEIKFENTTTFRYMDVAIDPATGKPLYTGTTREINSGLNLTINGWVSGDRMITMKVDAAISKQGDAGGNATNPPPTSERSVNTQVRTRSGNPIVIGGLIQVEKTQSVNRVPVLGYIPLVGRLFQSRVESDTTTEMVIYIVPFLHSVQILSGDYDKKNDDYYRRYGAGGL